ncbi:siphovirus Gp157 family protein [Gluconobacter cerinus]|uniref:siphovirus Gp157 family protein n=1 Tax=Gluconobacter cerinus TaxID=38307 RepID=UPI001B8CEF0F|nr:siphovirus Gp157 family protein [Gluconobacter cerinus]MBS1044530.1 siphovirus Gp157 family protein [Gluconobacter cerinus]
MSEALTKDLRDVANAEYAGFIKDGVQAYIDALMALRVANDPDSATVDLIYAAERAEAQFKAHVGRMRAALFAEMQATGQFEVEGNGVAASLRVGSTTGEVTDEKALKAAHPDLYLPQPDKLDRSRLTKMLKAIGSVPGAKLSTGAPTLAIRKV